jgi:transcriptional regulator with XRE-family HTH domain
MDNIGSKRSFSECFNNQTGGPMEKQKIRRVQLINERKSRSIEVRGQLRPWRQKDVQAQLQSRFNYQVSLSYIGAIERGERDPCLELCKLLSKLYGRPIEELL